MTIFDVLTMIGGLCLFFVRYEHHGRQSGFSHRAVFPVIICLLSF